MAVGGNTVVPGTVLAQRYRIEVALGAGGMAAVYRALDLALNRRIAIKILDERIARFEGLAITRERFFREARAMAAIDSPYVVPIHDIGRDGGRLFLVEKLLSGFGLEELLQSRQPLVSEVLAWIDDALAGLEAIHTAGLIHRDVNPSNLFITEPGAVLIDLGIALGDDDRRITDRNLVLGTPEFMAPEQATGKPLTATSDLYSLALVLLFVAGGRRELVEDQASVDRRLDGDGWLRRELAVVSAPLRPILRKALARDPSARYPSARAMRGALRELPALDQPVPFQPLVVRSGS